MKLESFLGSLKRSLSEGSRILTDRNDQEFKTSLERWSDIDLQVPAAIVKPISEADAAVIVSPHGRHLVSSYFFRDHYLLAVAPSFLNHNFGPLILLRCRSRRQSRLPYHLSQRQVGIVGGLQ